MRGRAQSCRNQSTSRGLRRSFCLLLAVLSIWALLPVQAVGADVQTNAPSQAQPAPAPANLPDSPAAGRKLGNPDPAQNPTPVLPERTESAVPGVDRDLQSTNLLPGKLSNPEQQQLEVLTNRLAQARAQREIRDFKQAEKTLVGLLTQDAPAELHREALLELAFTVQDQNNFPRAQQIFGQYVQRYKQDASVSEVLLRQGLLYRKMGVSVLALSKFYAVMSSALTLKVDRLEYYQRLVLQAQTEIADTYYLDGEFVEAADFFGRLLKLDCPELNREQVLYKLVRAWSGAGRPSETLAQGQLFVTQYPGSAQLAEVRFLMAKALKELGRKNEGHEQFLALLRDQQSSAAQHREQWLYWQQRTGNELANQLYQDGNYVQALDIYLRLAELNSSPTWRLPVLYQAGLIYEHLKQPEKASETYTRLIEEGSEPTGTTPTQGLSTVLEMAKWRKDRLGWFTRASAANLEIRRAADHPPESKL